MAIQRRLRLFSVRFNRFTTPVVGKRSAMLATPPAVFKRDKKRAPSVVAECPSGRSGTLRTTREGKSPMKSGTAVATPDASSDAESRSPDLNRRGSGRPERDRSGSFTLTQPLRGFLAGEASYVIDATCIHDG